MYCRACLIESSRSFLLITVIDLSCAKNYRLIRLSWLDSLHAHSLLELGQQVMRPLTQQDRIHPNGDKQCAQGQIMPCGFYMSLQYPRGLACSHDCTDSSLDSRDHLGMCCITDVPHAGSQICRANKHSIDSFHLDNFLKELQPLHCLHLAQQTDLLVGKLQIIWYCSPLGSPGQGRPDPPVSLRRITQCLYCSLCLGSCLYHGHKKVLRPYIQ